MKSVRQSQFSPLRSQAPGPLDLSSQSFDPPSPTTTMSCLTGLGPLTPADEDFNQFFIDVRRNQTEDSDGSVMVAVIGVGYVGYQLVQSFAKHYSVIAYDVSKHRIEALRPEFEGMPVYLTTNPNDLAQATHILIAVPTRVHEEDKSVDTSHLRSAISTVAEYARPGVVVVVESSVAVGMTRSLLSPLQQSKGVRAGMSPERVDPGRTNVDFEAIPKVVSGLDDQSLREIQELYTPVFDRVVPVSSCEVAEMTKLYENCQRMICIAYANEMADACQTIGIDPIEVCAAAATKPFGYQSYLPGPGVGGHCIPVNPYYLLSNMQFPLLQAATEKMWHRPAALVDDVMNSLPIRPRRSTDCRDPCANTSSLHEDTKSTRILVVGVGFKPGQSVTSHSPGVAMIDHLAENYDDVCIDFCDPLVGADVVKNAATKLNDAADWNAQTLDERYDAILVAVAQHGLDLGVLTSLRKAKVFNWTSLQSSSSSAGFGSWARTKGQQGGFRGKRDSAVAF